MNDVKTFASDLWNDLRARRLWPVAVLLLVGLVAAPVVLSKKAEEPAAPAPLPAAPTQADGTPGPEALAAVTLEDLTKGSGSSLSAFDESNPFAPPSKVLEAARREAQGDTGTDTGGAPTDTGTDTGATTDDGSTGGDTPDTGDGDGDGASPKTGEFTYVIDVTFWANGRKRTIEGLKKLEMLPNEAAPLLIFMGVTDSAGNAVFLVDSTLDTAGEGKCKPSRDDCAFLYLGAGSEQEFNNDDGDSYRLRINEIRKVKVGDGSGTAASKASKQNSNSAHAAVGGSTSSRRFEVPLITDLVVESSTDDQDRR
jgi:hypothetical protein